MSELMSIAAQIQVPEKNFNAWLKRPVADDVTVLDTLAACVDQSDRCPEEPFLCQYLPDQALLLFFRASGRNLDDAAPVLALFRQLAQLAEGAAQGYLCAGHYPGGSEGELACWKLGGGRLRSVARLPEQALDLLMPRVDVLLRWMPEQRRHQKKLFFRALLLRFNKLGNAWVRRASPQQIILYDDHDPYLTDGTRVFYTAGWVEEADVVEGADPYRLRRLAGRLWADDQRLYFKGQVVASLDRSPRVVGQAVVVGEKAYLAERDGSGLCMDDIHPATFRRLGAEGGYYADRSHVWCGMRLLPEAPEDFDVLEYGLARGRHAVYLYGRTCEGVDPASFVAAGHGRYHDADHRWSVCVTSSKLCNIGPVLLDPQEK
ncbi:MULTISPECIES: DKNYY domain-containing protein [Stenotrophomonas]|uniref:Uncharacterized protein n=1 Tax=Stenotrophomonas maltophilia TaxID=40324 RepID=A0A431UG35_STEMA|nr:DKNYY domain-containing protein [Stenotrophomonas maltophilia]RTQ88286.1 hypothetical protein EKL94_13280 [Stenotrophomonas maltophilia]